MPTTHFGPWQADELTVRLWTTCLVGVICGGILGYLVGLGASLRPYLTVRPVLYLTIEGI